MSARRARAAPTLNPAWMLEQLRCLLAPLAGRALCVAFSGGLDSTVLLHLLARGRHRGRYTLRAIHVHHHLQPSADAWAQAVTLQARRLAVPLQVLHLALRAQRGLSPEAVAREARYCALAAALAPEELLLCAHHLDDQFETLLLALLRGAGVAGLASMPAVKSLGAHQLIRPLLSVSRSQLQAYAQRHRLAWSEDPSNADPRFDRNYLRQCVLPRILARWPAAAVTAARSAAHLVQAQNLLDGLADAHLGEAADGPDLAASALRRLPLPARCNLLRRWLRGLGVLMPDHRRMQQLAGPLLDARADAVPAVGWGGIEVRRHGDRLMLVRRPDARAGDVADAADVTTFRWRWRRQPWLDLPGGGAIGWVRDAHGPLDLARLPVSLNVRFRRGGERLSAAHGRSRLKKLLQATHIAPWQRAALPLLFDGEQLVAVADIWFDQRYAASRDGQPGGRGRGRLRWRAPAND